MSGLQDIVFDSRRPASIARFWAVALDEYMVAPYDEAELGRLREIGVDDPEEDPTLASPDADATPARLVERKATSSVSCVKRRG